MTRLRQPASWNERVPLSFVYPLVGGLLSLAPPVGLIVLRALQARSTLTFDWITSHVREDFAAYLYLISSTLLVFGVLGVVLGRKEDRMQSLMMTDPLTGLHNRRYLDRRLDGELARVARYGGDLSLLVIDVDHLKQINDRLGHEGGDNALQAVASAIRESLRATDMAARIGGDEFVVLCPFTRAEETLPLTERIQSRLQALTPGAPVTVSIGVTDVQQTPALSPTEVFDAADRALFQAKAAGRNRMEVARRHRDPEPSRLSRPIR